MHTSHPGVARWKKHERDVARGIRAMPGRPTSSELMTLARIVSIAANTSRCRSGVGPWSDAYAALRGGIERALEETLQIEAAQGCPLAKTLLGLDKPQLQEAS